MAPCKNVQNDRSAVKFDGLCVHQLYISLTKTYQKLVHGLYHGPLTSYVRLCSGTRHSPRDLYSKLDCRFVGVQWCNQTSVSGGTQSPPFPFLPFSKFPPSIPFHFPLPPAPSHYPSSFLGPYPLNPIRDYERAL